MAKILLVEDEIELANMMADWLSEAAHQVTVIGHGDQAHSEIQSFGHSYELLVLDLMLPGTSGLELCRTYRKNSGYAPILIVSARRSLKAKQLAFDFGADDYVTKPFHLKELSMRVTALLRRERLVNPIKQYCYRDIVMEPTRNKVMKRGVEIHLSPQEFRLLEFLFKNPNKLFSADELRISLWESDDTLVNDTVRGHIKRLRQKLDGDNGRSIIVNVYGAGYRVDSDNSVDKP